MFEDTAGQGVADLNTGANFLYQTQADAYRARMAFDEEPMCRLFEAEPARRGIWTLNDAGPLAAGAEVVATIDGSSAWSHPLSVGTAGSERFEVDLVAPGAGTSTVTIEVRSTAGTEALLSQLCRVSPRSLPALPAGVHVALYDTGRRRACHSSGSRSRW